MNPREKKLAIAFGGVLALGLMAKYVVPGLKDTLGTGQRIESARAELEEVLAERDDLEDRLQRRYAEYVRRTGSTDPDAVYQAVSPQISKLITASGANTNASVKYSDPTIDRKTGVAYITLSVTANGTMAQCVEFVRSVYRLPYLIRFNSVKFSPTQRLQHKSDDNVKLDAEIEIAIPPKEELLGNPRGEQPDTVDPIKLDPTLVANWRPFNPYVEPTPPPTPPVIDEEPLVQAPPTPPPPAGPPEDPNAASQFLRMVISYGVDEVLIEDRARQTTDYIGVGDMLDAGKLVLVHALGAVVHKEDNGQDFGYWVYPIGQSLVRRTRLQDAGEWPEIQVAMLEYLRRQEQLREEQTPVGPPAPGRDELGDAGRAELPPLDQNAATAGATSALLEEFVGPPSLFTARPMVAEPPVRPRRPAPLVSTNGLGAGSAPRGEVGTGGTAPVRPEAGDAPSVSSPSRASSGRLSRSDGGAHVAPTPQPEGAGAVEDRAASRRTRRPVPRVVRPTPPPAEPAEEDDLAAPEDVSEPDDGVPPETDDPVPPE